MTGRARDPACWLLALLASALAACAGTRAPGNPSGRAVEPGSAPFESGSARFEPGPPGPGDAGDSTRRGAIGAESATAEGAESLPLGLELLMRLTDGAEALSAGRADEACERLQSAIDAGADDATAWFLLGVARLSAHDLPAARAALTTSLERDPDDGAVRCALARVAHLQGDLAGAIAELELATRRPDSDAREHALLGLLYLEGERIDEAYDTLQRAIGLDPDEKDAHRGLALLYMRVGDTERAELAWRGAVAIDPEDALLRSGLASTLREEGRLAEALPHYEALERLDPDNPLASANLAAVLADLGRPAPARDAYEHALERMDQAGEDRAWVLLGYGTTLETLGDHVGAVEAWEAALDDEPGLVEAHRALAQLAIDRDEPGVALRHLRALLEGDRVTAEQLLQLALLSEQEGDADTLQRCAQLLDSVPGDDPEILYRRAQLHLLARTPGIHDSALTLDIVHALMLGGQAGEPALWDLLGQALADQGSFERALEAVDRALAGVEPGGAAWQRYRDSREHYLSALVDR